jgi:tetratricopeptide (TPR) repeat protein
MEKEVKQLSLKAFSYIFNESEKCNRRFCFILGSGASREAGILTGVEMAKIWSERLREKYETDELSQLMKKLNINDLEPTSENYFGIYELMFYPDYRDGHSFFERELEKGTLSFGHHALAKILAGKTHNLAITTNFDSLIEDALFIYTEKRPLVIGHESLTEFADFNIERPIVAKIHRSLYFHPFNRKNETDCLAEGWKDTLQNAFRVYTPVVIGYAGGDKSLMEFLKDENTKMDGLYWCYYNREEPSEEIKALVANKAGCLIPIGGFDHMMFMLSRKLGFENPENKMREVTESRIETYNKRYEEFNEKIRDENKIISDESTMEIVKEMDIYNQKWLDSINNIPSDVATYNDLINKARLYSRLLKYDKAIEELGKAIKLKPENAEAYNIRGNNYSLTNDFKKALEDYNKAIELNPQYVKAYSNRANVYIATNEYEKALEDYNKAIELDPLYVSAYINRGDYYNIAEKYEEAMEDYNKAIELDPMNAEAYNNRGCIYNATKEYKEALEDYNKAIELNPMGAEVYNNRGNIYKAMMEYKKALEDYSKAIELNPLYAVAYNNRANIYIATNENEKALEDHNKANELNHMNAGVLEPNGKFSLTFVQHVKDSSNENSFREINDKILAEHIE